MTSIFGAFGPDGQDEQKNEAKVKVRRYLERQIQEYPIASTYDLVLMHDETRMIQSDADSIYSTVTHFQEKKPILLVLHSSGGFVGPAYLIGKLLRDRVLAPPN